MILAESWDCGWRLCYGNFNGVSVLEDAVYYALSSYSLDTGGALFRLDLPRKGIAPSGPRMVVELPEAAGESGQKRVPQGKIHTAIFRWKGDLLFPTHTCFYRLDGSRELVGSPPDGYLPYSGGGIFTWNEATRRNARLGSAPDAEGIIAGNFDHARSRFFGLTWPTGIFFRCDLETGDTKAFRGLSGEGEMGEGKTFFKLCRAIPICMDTGEAFFTNSEGTIYRYDPKTDDVSVVEEDSLRKDYLGNLDPHGTATMGYQWRQAIWNPGDGLIYASHIESDYLFTFDPRSRKVSFVERLACDPMRESGMNRGAGSLGLAFSPDGERIVYIAGAGRPEPVKVLVSGGAELVNQADSYHLMTWDLKRKARTDHGPICFPDGKRPLHINSLSIADDGTAYCLAFIPEGSGYRTDLISFKLP